MSRKRYTPEQIIGLLREAEVILSQGVKTPEVCRRLGVSEQVLIERWRGHYNTRRLDSRLGHRPPAPEAGFIRLGQAPYHTGQPGRKSTPLTSSHADIPHAGFCSKKKSD